ncbi:MAG: molybdopterin converting factor subunit 1 [Gammaproteobacteria bacterium]
MIRVLLFASVRDRVGAGQVDVDMRDAGGDVASLRRHLATRGGAWAEVFGDNDRLLVAINQEMVPMHTVIDDGDEVAFFPPVTGG